MNADTDSVLDRTDETHVNAAGLMAVLQRLEQ